MIKYPRLLLEFIIAQRKAIAAAVLITFVVFLFYLRNNDYLNIGNIIGFLNLHPVLAPLFFVVSYTLMIVFLVPTLPMNLGAGLLWGPFWGGAIAVVGASSGALLSFLTARYLAFDYFNSKFQSRFWLWLKKEIEGKNWKIVAFTRVNPAFPFGLVSYFFGLTPISLKRYYWTTVLAILPGAVIFAAVGDALGSLVLKGKAGDFFQTIILVAFLAAALIVILYIMKNYWHVSSPNKRVLVEENNQEGR